MLRFFSTTVRDVSSGKLAQLRKSTGLAFNQCRKALETCDNDLEKALEWLNAEAKKLGMQKVMKLASRTATEGLVAVGKSNNVAVMVELNCETEFVAKNEKFRSLIESAVKACIAQPCQILGKKVHLEEEELKNLRSPENTNFSEHIVKLTSDVGEKIVLRRALYYAANENVEIDVNVHPPTSNPGADIHTGKYGSMVVFRKKNANIDVNPSMERNFGSNLCKHVIGMKPIKIGDQAEDKPSEFADKESVLIHQEFLLDPSLTVGELLNEHNAEVIDFERYECGENPEVVEKAREVQA